MIKARQTRLGELLERFPVVALVGPRQCGKTTLAQIECKKRDGVYLDLERPSDRAKLSDAESYLALHRQRLVCLDEVHHAPEVFAVLRSLVDEERRPGRFLVLGSASLELLQQASESLAGRIAVLELTPFHLGDLRLAGRSDADALWLRGGYPESWLAEDSARSFEWRSHFVDALIRRDARAFLGETPVAHLDRCWRMLAHWHGQLWNGAAMARNLELSNPTAKRYLDLLRDLFLVRALPPFHANLKKRLVKSPKVYFRDSGLLHAVLGIATLDDLSSHPVYGASFEGFAIEQILAVAPPGTDAAFFRSHVGDEIDLILSRGRKRVAVEFKASTAPTLPARLVPTMHELAMPRAFIVHRGNDSFPLAPNVEATPLTDRSIAAIHAALE